MPDITAVFIIVLQFTALGYTASIVPDDPKFQVSYVSEAECKKQIPVVRGAMKIPSIATLNKITCRKLELRK